MLLWVLRSAHSTFFLSVNWSKFIMISILKYRVFVLNWYLSCDTESEISKCVAWHLCCILRKFQLLHDVGSCLDWISWPMLNSFKHRSFHSLNDLYCYNPLIISDTLIQIKSIFWWQILEHDVEKSFCFKSNSKNVYSEFLFYLCWRHIQYKTYNNEQT